MKPHFLLSFFLFSSISNFAQNADNQLLTILNRYPQYFEKLLQQPEKYQIQIIYTQINRDGDNQPHFQEYRYNVDEKRYFYPASTVKMPTAFVALEKLNRLKIVGLSRQTPLRIGAGSPPQTAVFVDTSAAPNFLPTVEHYIKKIFLYSDNDANNRLYEFCGQFFLNETLRSKGGQNVRIWHRLGVSGYDRASNQYTNPIEFFDGDKSFFRQGEVWSFDQTELGLHDEKRGVGYLSGDSIVLQPFDFSQKNFISLPDLTYFLRSVLFPESVPSAFRFEFSEGDYAFLYRAMSALPRESESPHCNEPDNYVKFFIYGDRPKDFKIPNHVRIFNKVGWAYGFLTDVAYVVDFEAKVEFMVSAVIHVNENQIYNDGVYEYESVGLPFFARLGEVLYEFEKERKRSFTPDLSKFKF